LQRTGSSGERLSAVDLWLTAQLQQIAVEQ